ncbi:DNA/RNA polymerases superfamily protein [Tanacetum coccineum]
MTETMEQYMSKTQENYGSGVTRPTINQDTPFELKGQFLKELRDNTFSGSEHEDANEHIEKVLEIVDLFHIPKMSKVLQERGFGSLPSSMETNPRDQVKLISTAKADFSKIRQAQDVKIMDAYDHTLPRKEKDPVSFTLPCFIHNICFDKALVDLGASVSVMPFFTYTNLGLGILSHTRLTIELADRTIKQLRGIAENVPVRIGFTIIDDDDMIKDVVLGMQICKKYASCQMIMMKFALEDECEQIVYDE